MVVLSQENWAGQGRKPKYLVMTCLQTGTFQNKNTKDILLVCEIINLTSKPYSQALAGTKLVIVIVRTLRPYYPRQTQAPLKAHPSDEWARWAHS